MGSPAGLGALPIAPHASTWWVAQAGSCSWFPCLTSGRGSDGSPDDAASQTKAFAWFLYHFLSRRIHLRPTCGCLPEPGSMQEICLEQHVKAAKKCTAVPTGTSRQHYNYLSYGDQLACNVSSPKTPALSYCTVALGEEGQCLRLLSDPDSRDVLWDHFTVATLVVPMLSHPAWMESGCGHRIFAPLGHKEGDTQKRQSCHPAAFNLILRKVGTFQQGCWCLFISYLLYLCERKVWEWLSHRSKGFMAPGAAVLPTHTDTASAAATAHHCTESLGLQAQDGQEGSRRWLLSSLVGSMQSSGEKREKNKMWCSCVDLPGKTFCLYVQSGDSKHNSSHVAEICGWRRERRSNSCTLEGNKGLSVSLRTYTLLICEKWGCLCPMLSIALCLAGIATPFGQMLCAWTELSPAASKGLLATDSLPFCFPSAASY